tara:strand:- start:642 stop:812 length:171 start_codon:yes stop_codon:yes gene_type:complete
MPTPDAEASKQQRVLYGLGKINHYDHLPVIARDMKHYKTAYWIERFDLESAQKTWN